MPLERPRYQPNFVAFVKRGIKGEINDTHGVASVSFLFGEVFAVERLGDSSIEKKFIRMHVHAKLCPVSRPFCSRKMPDKRMNSAPRVRARETSPYARALVRIGLIVSSERTNRDRYASPRRFPRIFLGTRREFATGIGRYA